MYQSLLKLYYMLSKREKRNAGILFVMMLIHATLEVIGVGVIPVYVSIVVFPGRAEQQPAIQAVFDLLGRELAPGDLLLWGSLALAIFFGVKALYVVLLAYWKMRFVQNRVFRLGEELFGVYMRAPYGFHLSRNSAELLRNINQECLTLGRRVVIPVLMIASHGVIFLALLMFLFVASPSLAAVGVLLLTSVAAAGVGFMHKRLHEKGLQAREHRKEVIQNIGEGLGGVKELRLLRREDVFIKKFAVSLRSLLSIQRYVSVISESINPIIEWVSVLGLLGLTVVLFLTYNDPELIVSTVVLFAVTLTRLKGSITQILTKYSGLRHSLVSVDTIYEDLNTFGQYSVGKERHVRRQGRPERETDEKNKHGLAIEEGIELSNVKFKYPDADEFALNDINLNIRKGEAIGIVGPTGSGKSTLVDIVLGVLIPDEGRILVDGTDIQENPAGWQRNIGYIPQAVYLVDGSIRQNVALGIPEKRIEDALLKQAARAAHLEEFVEKLPDGMDTIVGERGVRLSGGQRQRIAIARALYHEPELLVMDEATSALDNTTERAVIRAVDELKGGRTILMIAHRLSTVENCDRIVYLEEGKIQMVGTYDEMLKNHEAFRRMVAG